MPSLAEALGLTDDELAAAIGVAQAIASTITGVLDIAMQANQQRIDGIDRLANAEIEAIENSTLSEEAKSAKIKQIEQKAAQDKYKIELKQFKISQALQVTNAIIGTAQAAIAAYSSAAAVPIAGIALAPLMAGIAAGFGALQIGMILAQKPPAAPKFAKGGYVSGAGTETSDSIDARLSNGESVNNARTTRMFGREISAMNAAGGGVDWFKNTNASGNRFAQGGIVSPTFAARQTTQVAGLSRNDLAEVIAQMPAPIVTVSDINRVQGQVATVSQSADL